MCRCHVRLLPSHGRSEHGSQFSFRNSDASGVDHAMSRRLWFCRNDRGGSSSPRHQPGDIAPRKRHSAIKAPPINAFFCSWSRSNFATDKSNCRVLEPARQGRGSFGGFME